MKIVATEPYCTLRYDLHSYKTNPILNHNPNPNLNPNHNFNLHCEGVNKELFWNLRYVNINSICTKSACYIMLAPRTGCIPNSMEEQDEIRHPKYCINNNKQLPDGFDCKRLMWIAFVFVTNSNRNQSTAKCYE